MAKQLLEVIIILCTRKQNNRNQTLNWFFTGGQSIASAASGTGKLPETAAESEVNSKKSGSYGKDQPKAADASVNHFK